MKKKMKFNNDSRTEARFSVLKTQHGKLELPAVMPVATKGAVKLTSFADLKNMGFSAIISNSYLLSLKPGLEAVRKAKGLHNFIGWDKTIFTDSGGFQVARDFLISISDNGLVFKNPFTNEKTLLTPEHSMEIQATLQSDVAMILDDMPLYPCSQERAKESLERTFHYAKRCISHHKSLKTKQLLFGIAQGSVYQPLREQSIKQITSLDFDGYALGGLALNEPKKEMFKIISNCAKLPEEKPRYIMGLGTWQDILKSISLGADLFDSAYITKVARHGRFFTTKGHENLLLSKNIHSQLPLDKNCNCQVCQSHSRAYLRHLFKVNEDTGMHLTTHHNLFFMANLMKEARESLKQNDFKNFLKQYKIK